MLCVWEYCYSIVFLFIQIYVYAFVILVAMEAKLYWGTISGFKRLCCRRVLQVQRVNLSPTMDFKCYWGGQGCDILHQHQIHQILLLLYTSTLFELRFPHNHWNLWNNYSFSLTRVGWDAYEAMVEFYLEFLKGTQYLGLLLHTSKNCKGSISWGNPEQWRKMPSLYSVGQLEGVSWPMVEWDSCRSFGWTFG